MITRRHLLRALLTVPFAPAVLRALSPEVATPPAPWTTETWTTRDWRVIPITELTDEHLGNILRMLERNHDMSTQARQSEADTIYDMWLRSPREQTHEAWLQWQHWLDRDREAAKALEVGPTYDFPIYPTLCAEAIRRGRTW